MIVVDASAILEVLVQSRAARGIEQLIFSSGEKLHAPHLIDLELAQVFRRLVQTGAMSPDEGSAALAVLADLPIMRYPHLPLLVRVWQLRNNLTAYDAAYLALAEALDATLVTRDRALAAATSHARVKLV